MRAPAPSAVRVIERLGDLRDAQRLLALDRLPEAQREARVRLSVAVLVGLSLDYLGSGNAHAYADAYRDWVRLNLGI